MFTPSQFGAHWRKLMEGFLRDAQALDALLVKYEDLVGGLVSLDGVDSYLGISVDRRVLERNVGSSERGGEKVHVNALERWLLRREVGPVAAQLAYAW